MRVHSTSYISDSIDEHPEKFLNEICVCEDFTGDVDSRIVEAILTLHQQEVHPYAWWISRVAGVSPVEASSWLKARGLRWIRNRWRVVDQAAFEPVRDEIGGIFEEVIE